MESMDARKLQVLVIGYLPPPYFGPSVTFQALMRSKFPEKFDVVFVEQTVSGAAAVIVMGESQRFNFERWLPAEKIFVVGSGIETSELPKRSVGADHPFTVLFLSNLIREKGVFVLLEAARKIVAARPP